jgi:predicted transcriptional regulator
MKYKSLHRLRIVQVLDVHGCLSFRELRSRWLDICDAFIMEESFQTILTELEGEGLIRHDQSNESYQLTDQGKHWLKSQNVKNDIHI